MNFIFVHVKEQEDEYKIIERRINENINIKEFVVSNRKIKEIIELKQVKEKNIFKRLKNKYSINKYEKNIQKLIKQSCLLESKAIFSKKLISENESYIYLKEMFEKQNIQEYIYKGEYEKNIQGHIKEYCENKIDKPVIASKVLLVYKELDNLNEKLLEKLIDTHKIINILAIDEVSKYQLKKIKKINELYGTTISVINKNKKAFKEYDIVLFMDVLYDEVKRYRFSKEALKIYLLDTENDYLDKNNIYIKDLIKERKVLESIIEKLQSIYGQNTVASIIAKLHKTIDKTQKME